MSAASPPPAQQRPGAHHSAAFIADDSQRLLYRVILEDALEWHLAAIGDCPECEWLIETGICARHWAGHAGPYAAYQACAAYFEETRSYRRARITAGQLRLIAQAIPRALAYRSGPAPADQALSAAYAELRRRLAAAAIR